MKDSTNYEATRAARAFEWRAVVAGCAVNFVMTTFEKIPIAFFLSANYGMFVSPNTAQSSRLTYFAVRCCLAVANGVIVGFTSAKLARSHKYRNALIAAVFTLFLSVVGAGTPLAFVFGLLPWERLVPFVTRNVFFVPAAFYGAYMAQSFERNRGVKID